LPDPAPGRCAFSQTHVVLLRRVVRLKAREASYAVEISRERRLSDQDKSMLNAHQEWIDGLAAAARRK